MNCFVCSFCFCIFNLFPELCNQVLEAFLCVFGRDMQISVEHNVFLLFHNFREMGVVFGDEQVNGHSFVFDVFQVFLLCFAELGFGMYHKKDNEFCPFDGVFDKQVVSGRHIYGEDSVLTHIVHQAECKIACHVVFPWVKDDDHRTQGFSALLPKEERTKVFFSFGVGKVGPLFVALVLSTCALFANF